MVGSFELGQVGDLASGNPCRFCQNIPGKSTDGAKDQGTARARTQAPLGALLEHGSRCEMSRLTRGD